MDALAVTMLFGLLAFLLSRGMSFLAWLRREMQLIRADNWWTDAHIVNPALGSQSDRRVARLVERQRYFGRHLRKKKRSLLTWKPCPPPLADRVALPNRKSA